jgi:hypothetical protein
MAPAEWWAQPFRRNVRTKNGPKLRSARRLDGLDGQTTEWKSKTLRAYQRRTLAADALIASTYLAGTNTRRVRRALAALFGGAVGKDTVSNGEPGVAEGEGRLGGLERSLARGGADRAADPLPAKRSWRPADESGPAFQQLNKHGLRRNARPGRHEQKNQD